MSYHLVDAASNAITIAAADVALFGADLRRAAMDGVQLAGSGFAATFLEGTVLSILPANVGHFSNVITTGAVYAIADNYLANCPFDNWFGKFFYAAGSSGIGTTFVAPTIAPML